MHFLSVLSSLLVLTGVASAAPPAADRGGAVVAQPLPPLAPVGVPTRTPPPAAATQPYNQTLVPQTFPVYAPANTVSPAQGPRLIIDPKHPQMNADGSYNWINDPKNPGSYPSSPSSSSSSGQKTPLSASSANGCDEAMLLRDDVASEASNQNYIFMPLADAQKLMCGSDPVDQDFVKSRQDVLQKKIELINTGKLPPYDKDVEHRQEGVDYIKKLLANLSKCVAYAEQRRAKGDLEERSDIVKIESGNANTVAVTYPATEENSQFRFNTSSQTKHITSTGREFLGQLMEHTGITSVCFFENKMYPKQEPLLQVDNLMPSAPPAHAARQAQPRAAAVRR